jgi:hypothetical protein
MTGEILAETCGQLLQACIYVPIHGEDDGRNGLIGYRFIVGVGFAPNDGASGWIVQFEVQRETSHESGLIDAIQLEQVAPQDVIATDAGGDTRDRCVLAGIPESGNQRVLNHIRRSLGPTIVFVGAELDLTGTIDETVIAVEMRSSETPDQEADGHGRGGSGGRSGWNVQHVIFNGAGRAAGGNETRDDGKNHNKLHATPGHSSLLLAKFRAIQRTAYGDYLGSADPGLCSLGEESRSRV